MPTRLPLLDPETDTFTPKTESTLKSIFTRFDKDQDGLLSKQEIDEFAKAANGQPFDDESYNELIHTFETKTLNNEPFLTLDGFLDMYHLQTMSDEEETWRDLRAFGYGGDLELRVKEDGDTPRRA